MWTDGGGYAWLKGARRTEAGWNVPCVCVCLCACVCVCSWMKHHIPSQLLLKHPFFSLSGPFPTLILTSHDSLMSNPLLSSVVSILAKDYLVMNKVISSSCI